MTTKKEVKKESNNDFNDKIFVKIQKLQADIEDLKGELKPTEAIKNASLAECNALNKKHDLERAKASKEA